MKNEEHKNQHALVSWWAIVCKKYNLPEFALYACPNGGARNAVTGAILKREGVRRGIPDLFLAHPSNGFAGMYIEMKASKGVISKDQQAFIDHASKNYNCVICYDWMEAKTSIESYLTALPEEPARIEY